MVRDLTTCENTGTVVRHKVAKVEATIKGAYVGGFVVEIEGKPLMLPFSKLAQFEVVE
jgi:hypothetical protein